MEVFNTEAGRLLGWLKTAREAQDEAGIAGAEGYWNSNQKIGRVALLPESVDVFENFSK
jgi:kynureninase